MTLMRMPRTARYTNYCCQHAITHQLQPDARHASHRPAAAAQPRSRPPAATAPARAAPSPPKARPRLAQRPEARPRRPAPFRPRGRGPGRARGADRPADGRGSTRERDRGPAGPPDGDRVLEGRARRADRGGIVRRRAQTPPAPSYRRHAFSHVRSRSRARPNPTNPANPRLARPTEPAPIARSASRPKMRNEPKSPRPSPPPALRGGRGGRARPADLPALPRVGSHGRLLPELRRRGAVTRLRQLASGRTIGGIPFSRGRPAATRRRRRAPDRSADRAANMQTAMTPSVSG